MLTARLPTTLAVIGAAVAALAPSRAAGRSTADPVGIWVFAPQRGSFTKISLDHSATSAPETYALTGLGR